MGYAPMDSTIISIHALARTPRPGTCTFELSWATPRDLSVIIPLMRSQMRQTMNIRNNPGARMFKVCYEGKIIGWAGLDVESDPEHPEFFSLYVFPRFRRYRLGLLLELARYTYAASHGVSFAYVRMEAASNAALMYQRIASGLWSMVAGEDLEQSWRDGCKSCELYGVECTSQRYLKVDIDQARARAEAKLGELDLDTLPRQLNFEYRAPRPKAPAAVVPIAGTSDGIPVSSQPEGVRPWAAQTPANEQPSPVAQHAFDA